MSGAPNLPTVASRNAPLPQMYEQARTALSECSRVDECKDWADKAQALASYARQADDDSLEKLALRIRARATRRAGELLKTFQNQKAGLKNVGNGARGVGTGPTSQREAAEAAGMSERQEKTAVRVANVPEADFERAVESESPPTITKLSEQGKATAERMTEESSRPGFYAATHTVGAMKEFAAKCAEHEPEFVAGGLLPREHANVRALVHQIDAWLDRFIVNLSES